MDDGVWILGGYQSDFARNLSKENRDFADLTREVVDGTLTAAKVDAADLAAAGVVHVANAFGEMFARQGHLGAMPATVCDDLWDTPATRHEAACASGSVATLAAMADLRSGAYRVALVVGLELEKTVPGDTAAEHLSAAAWTGHEGAEARYLWPSMFAQVADDTTGDTVWMTLTCGPSLNSTSPTRAATPTRRPAAGRSPTRSPTTTRPTLLPKAGCDGLIAAR